MYTYKQMLNPDNSVSNKHIWRIEDGACVPFDPANTDYQAYLKFLEEGGVPEPADEPQQ
jgi:hypothetical protein